MLMPRPRLRAMLHVSGDTAVHDCGAALTWHATNEKKRNTQLKNGEIRMARIFRAHGLRGAPHASFAALSYSDEPYPLVET
jgi:hypothetical protein